MHLETAVTVKAPRAKVYAAYTDFESLPKWSKMRGTVTVTKKEGDMVYLESDAGSHRRGRNATRSLKLTEPSLVESESETRFTRTKRTVAFDEVPEGTKVTAKLEVQVKGLWAKLLATRQSDEFEPAILKELESFARYVESLS